MVGAVGTTIALALASSTPAAGQSPITVARIIDADTFELGDGERLRLVGVDTPETWRPQCRAERVAGEIASAVVEIWLAQAASVTVTLDGRRDRWGRLLGDVILDGDSLSTRLIQGHLGAAYEGEGPRPDWCAVDIP